MRQLLALALAAAVALSAHASLHAAGGAPRPPAQDWSFGGLFGTFDRASAQRGFQVYKQVCAACHA
jgi:cytochrome c1